MYGQPITLRYKRNKMFYTNYGALASIFVYCAVIQILTKLLIEVISKDRDLITSQTANEFESFETVKIKGGKVTLSESQKKDLEHYQFLMGYRLVNATTSKTIPDDQTLAYVRIDHITSFYERDNKDKIIICVLHVCVHNDITTTDDIKHVRYPTVYNIMYIIYYM